MGALFLFLLFRSLDPKAAALAGGEDGLGGVVVCAVGRILASGTDDEILAGCRILAVGTVHAVETIDNGDGRDRARVREERAWALWRPGA